MSASPAAGCKRIRGVRCNPSSKKVRTLEIKSCCVCLQSTARLTLTLTGQWRVESPHSCLKDLPCEKGAPWRTLDLPKDAVACPQPDNGDGRGRDWFDKHAPYSRLGCIGFIYPLRHVLTVVTAPTSAPLSSSALTLAAWPNCAAQCSAVESPCEAVAGLAQLLWTTTDALSPPRMLTCTLTRGSCRQTADCSSLAGHPRRSSHRS